MYRTPLQSKKEGKDQVSTQLSTTLEPGYQYECIHLSFIDQSFRPIVYNHSQLISTTISFPKKHDACLIDDYVYPDEP